MRPRLNCTSVRFWKSSNNLIKKFLRIIFFTALSGGGFFSPHFALHAAFVELPPAKIDCAFFLEPYFTKMAAIHREGTKWYFSQRRWDDYLLFFGAQWAAQVTGLAEDEVWIDSGAGSGNALIDYLAKFNGKAVGIAAAVSNWDRYWIHQSMQHFVGRFDFYIGLLETPLSFWPQIPRGKVLTDLYGPMAYTHAPDLLLRHYAEFLVPGGTAWIFIPQDSLLLWQKPQVPLTWPAYLALCQGLKWQNEFLVQEQRYPHRMIGRILVVERTDDAVSIAPLIAVMEQFKFNIPPRRSFIAAARQD